MEIVTDHLRREAGTPWFGQILQLDQWAKNTKYLAKTGFSPVAPNPDQLFILAPVCAPLLVNRLERCHPSIIHSEPP